MARQELQKKIDFAIRLLRSISEQYDNQPIEVAYSGGKDSDVILQLAKEAGINYRAIYKNTTIDPPGTIKHVEEMGVEIFRPKRSFLQLIKEKGLPSRFRRFCCSELKEYKILDKAIIGVRKEESIARFKRYHEPTECRFYSSKKEHVEAIYPILEWTKEDVADFIEDRKIKCAPIYYDEQGKFHVERRLGCIGCPLASVEQRVKVLQKYPNMVKSIIRAMQYFIDTHPNSVASKRHQDAIECFVHDVFYPGSREWYVVRDGLFGKPDFKGFLENKFNIKL